MRAISVSVQKVVTMDGPENYPVFARLSRREWLDT